MRQGFCLVALYAALGCAAPPARVPEADRARAEAYARRGEECFDHGDRERGLALATRALVVRLAACAYDCPDVAYSFVQLGDMRYLRGELGHAAQSYRRALEVLAPHAETQADWIRATITRLQRTCHELAEPTAACSGT